MQQALSATPIGAPLASQGDVEQSGGPGRILLRIFEMLEQAGIQYCVLHGYESYPAEIKSDVDCVIDPKITPGQLLALLVRHRGWIGADVVCCRGYYIVLAGRNADGSRCFLTLDMAIDCEIHDLPLYAGQEVLATRRRHRHLWIPSPDVEFSGYLARTIAKGTLDDERAKRLDRLYQQDAVGCSRQVERFWSGQSRELIRAAAKTGDWELVRQHLGKLRGELRRRAIVQRPARFVKNKLRALLGRLRRVCQPDGLAVVLLGPDGAGKSSTIEALAPRLTSAFARCTCWGFAPPLARLLGRRPSTTSEPHALPARSLLTSLARAAYWFAYYTVGHFTLRLALARSTLVLYDRHFLDILVDVRRYRYGGPVWLLRLIWLLIPKPDLILLLDAPPALLQERKQEVSFEETARQRNAYLALVRSMENGRIIDATQQLNSVADDAAEVVIGHLTMRVRRRFELEQNILVRAE